ncbi:F-box protein CPR1 [Bienertia sinuspersici]
MANLNSGDNNLIDINSLANDSSPQTQILAEDIIFNEILPRLPVKSLIRFKSVCKLWRSTISSSKFVNMHFNFSSACAHHFILPCNGLSTSNLKIFSYDELNNLNPVEVDVIDPLLFVKEGHLVESFCVSNGLLCLCIGYTDINADGIRLCSYYSIYNPALRRYCEIVNPVSQQCLHPSRFWFGYVPSIDDYKIIARLGQEFKDAHYYVYSLKSGTWKSIPNLDIVMFRYEELRMNTTVIDDLLYWSPTDINYEMRPIERIIGFNVVTEQVKELPSMNWLSAYVDTEFFVMNGCLSLYCYSLDPDSPFSDVWMLRQHDDWISWEKSFSVHHGGLFLRNVFPTGKFLLFRYAPEMQIQLKMTGISNNVDEQIEGDTCFLHKDAVDGDGGGFYAESLIWPSRTVESIEEDLKV